LLSEPPRIPCDREADIFDDIAEALRDAEIFTIEGECHTLTQGHADRHYYGVRVRWEGLATYEKIRA